MVVVVASGGGFPNAVLRQFHRRGAAELATPVDERVVEQSAALEEEPVGARRDTPL